MIRQSEGDGASKGASTEKNASPANLARQNAKPPPLSRVDRLVQVVGWHWLPMNRPVLSFLPLVDLVSLDGIVLSDLGLRCKAGLPDYLKLCLKGTWNDRFMAETTFSLLTVVCHTKKMFHRTAAHLEARLAYTAAMLNVLIGLERQIQPYHAFTLSIADFSL